MGRLLAIGIVLFVGMLLLDWWLHLGTYLRLATLALYVAGLCITTWITLLRPLRDRWSDREVLARVDATAPPGEEGLLELYEFIHSPEQIQEMQTEQGKHLAASAVTQLGERAAQTRLGSAVTIGPARRWLLIAGTFALVLAGLGIALPSYLAIGSERFINPLSKARWPHRTTIAVQTPANGWVVPQLDPIAVQAEVTGDVPKRLQLAYRVGGTGNWTKENVPVQENHSTDRTTYTINYIFPEVRDPIEFTLEGGDYRTDPQHISIIQKPFLKSITAHYEYPSYAGLPNRTVNNGQLSGLEGTQVRLVMESSMPLERAVFIFTPEDAKNPEQRNDIERVGATTFQKTLMLEHNGRYRVELYEANGFREARNEVYEVRITPDDPPEIELLAPGKDLAETKQASLDVAFRARDKLGLAKVEFLYQIDEKPLEPLTDRITGPIPQAGNDTTVRFHWDLRKMDLPDSGNIRYFVRVQDNNPTGRGKVTSAPGQIKLIKPSDFHLETLEQTKQLEEEARIAWRNQLLAWKRGTQWLEKGTGAEDDAIWNEMQEAQQKAFAAARQIQFHFRNLTEKYERNHMGQDFMAARLSVVAQLLTRLLDQEHTPLAVELASARPRNAADAMPERLKSLRSTALSKGKDHQKMATLVLEQMLRRLYDWRDLQTSTVTTKLLYADQEEVLALTQQVAPKTIGKEIEDLKDADQQVVLTLGKKQRGIFDTETGLETQLTYLMYKAEKQGRKTILEPLQGAFTNLRSNRVNFHLKRSAELIENNQQAQIIDNQKAALRALEVAQAGLMLAGQKVDPEQPLTLAMNPIDESLFDPDQIKPEVAKVDPKTMDEPKTMEMTETIVEVPTLPEGADPLSAAIRLTIELQDNVLARVRYLDKNREATEMPRFIKLKQSRLAERQTSSLKALDQAVQEADKQKESHVRAMLQQVRDEMSQSLKLLETGAGDSSPGVQQLQIDFIENLKGQIQHLALQRTINDAVAENKRQNGVDGFGRKYLLREADLDIAINLILQLDRARQMRADVLRKIERFQKFIPKTEPLTAIEKTNRERAAAAEQQVAKAIEAIPALRATFSKDVATRIKETPLAAFGMPPLPMETERIRTGKADAEVALTLRSSNQILAESLQALRDLLEERVREETKVAIKDPTRMTQELLEKLQSRENLAKMLKEESSLPPEVRAQIVRALEKEFPAKYRELLQAYYGSLITPRKE
ncbi:MAG: hypothetical protein K8T89_01895 [Planctomycetes bacterium]|nr:hypothetical protein [Planctomycetota bacterium]